MEAEPSVTECPTDLCGTAGVQKQSKIRLHVARIFSLPCIEYVFVMGKLDRYNKKSFKMSSNSELLSVAHTFCTDH